MKHGFSLQATAGLVLLLLTATACGRDDGAGVRGIDQSAGTAHSPGTASVPGGGSASSAGSAALDPAKADTRVGVTLSEWMLRPQPAQVNAGVVAFDVKNEGSVKHEVVILRADSAESLPTQPDGTVEEDKLGAQNSLGEVEVDVGKTEAVAFRLAPGNYVLICNIVDDKGAHFMHGMHAPLKVT
jgi:uncharacterized cupredoxin-like copper-binding protein